MLGGVIIARVRVREGRQDGWSDDGKESDGYLAWCPSDLFLKPREIR